MEFSEVLLGELWKQAGMRRRGYVIVERVSACDYFDVAEFSQTCDYWHRLRCLATRVCEARSLGVDRHRLRSQARSVMFDPTRSTKSISNSIRIGNVTARLTTAL